MNKCRFDTEVHYPEWFLGRTYGDSSIFHAGNSDADAIQT